MSRAASPSRGLTTIEVRCECEYDESEIIANASDVYVSFAS